MPDKMTVMFDPSISGHDELRKMYQRVFKIREKRPEDFIWSAFFSAFVDAKESGSRVYFIRDVERPGSRIVVDFKRL